ncbi:MAG: ribosome maturation factor RimM [Actinomycetota bacterium]
MPDAGERVAIARLGRPHGVRGAITAHADGPTLGTLGPGDAVVVRVHGHDRPLVLADRRGEAPKAIVSFEGVDDRDAAAALTGGSVMVEPSRLPAPDDPDTFYVRDLIGFEVRCGERLVGTVRDVQPGPANDALAVVTPDGEILLPFTADAVTAVDGGDRRITLREGLL